MGRPRRSGNHPSGETREEILNAAAELFSNQGFNGTSIGDIANAAGLQRGSLSYWFPHKMDLLAELLDRVVTPALDYAAELETVDAPIEVKLGALVLRDVHAICDGAHSIGAIALWPAARASRFDDFWRKRATLFANYEALLRRGQQTGVVRDTAVRPLTEAVFGLIESPVIWYRHAERDDEDEVAASLCDSVLRLCMEDQGSVAATVEAAFELFASA